MNNDKAVIAKLKSESAAKSKEINRLLGLLNTTSEDLKNAIKEIEDLKEVIDGLFAQKDTGMQKPE